MKIKSSFFYGLIYSIIILLFSLFIFKYYIGGDQRFYTPFYNYCLSDIRGVGWKFQCYKEIVGAQEPIYFFISYLFSFFTSKIFYTSVTNAILIFLLVKVVFKYYSLEWHRHVFILFLLSNYYMLGLLFSTERLKIGFIFLLMAIYFNKKKLYILIAIFSHLQILFAVVPFYISILLKSSVKFWFKFFLILMSTAGLFLLFLVMQNQIYHKFNAYYQETQDLDMGFIGIIKTSFFIILSSITVKKYEPLITGAPLVLMSYFIGSTRLGMMVFILYLFYAIRFNKRMDFVMILVLSYFSYKSIDFISNVFMYGEGWKVI